ADAVGSGTESELFQHAHSEIVEALALGAQPPLEFGGRAIHAFEELAAIERSGAIEPRRPHRKRDKLEGVGFDAIWLKGHRIAVAAQGIKAGLPERLAHTCERLF